MQQHKGNKLDGGSTDKPVRWSTDQRAIEISLADCGGWFDDYVVELGGELLGIYPRVRAIPREYIAEWLRHLKTMRELTPVGAAALVGIADELNNSRRGKE